MDQGVTVGLVQIGGLQRQHQRRQEWAIRDSKPVPSVAEDARAMSQCFYLPYSVGLLQAYTQRHATNPNRYRFLPPIFSNLAVASAADQLASAQVVGFSAYVWNVRQSLALAAAIKQRRPDCLIVFGGPQVPDQAETFLREHPFIDVACHGEGEQVFLSLLEQYPSRDWRAVASISYLTDGGRLAVNPRAPRITSLDDIPSPYLEHVFDDLLRDNPQHEWLVTCETNRGCPFSCTFCDWGSATATHVYRFDLERVKAEFDWFIGHGLNQIFICDANFGLLPRDVEIAEYLVGAFNRRGLRGTVIVQSTKNATERAYRVNQLLTQVGTAGATLALQSVNPVTLQNIRRDNISLESYHELQRRYRQDNIKTYTDVIIGLPGETYASFASGLAEIIQRGQHNRLAVYNCSLLPNAEMSQPEQRQRFGLRTVLVPQINEYEPVALTDQREISEYLETVVATASMPAEDWVRAKVYTWLADLLHYDRVLQLVFVVLQAAHKISYRELIEAFQTADTAAFPICGEILSLFERRARANQSGETEFQSERQWLGLWWPVHQFALLSLLADSKLDAFYDEAEQILKGLLRARLATGDDRLVQEAVQLNRAVLSRPFEFSDQDVNLSFDLWECYADALQGAARPPRPVACRYRIDHSSRVWLTWAGWCAELVARSYDRGGYFCRLTRLPDQPVGERLVAPPMGVGQATHV